MSNEDSEPGVNERFASVAREPIAPPPDVGADPDAFPERRIRLGRWLSHLRDEFPLWSFQPFAYYRRQDHDAPITYPLQTIIDSLLTDDGLTPGEQEPLDPLLATMDRRRQYLARGHGDLAHWAQDENADQPVLVGGITQFFRAPRLFHEGSESRYHYDPPRHEALDIGVRLCRLIEERERARLSGNAPQAKTLQDEIDGFLRGIRALQVRGRPRERPSDDIIQKLVHEGRGLIELVWEGPENYSDDFVALLDRHEVAEEERPLSSFGLSLPVFSLHELRVVLDQRRRVDDVGRGRRPTPRRLAIFAVASRLDLEAHAVDRIHAGGGGGEEFRRVPNPFQQDSS